MADNSPRRPGIVSRMLSFKSTDKTAAAIGAAAEASSSTNISEIGSPETTNKQETPSQDQPSAKRASFTAIVPLLARQFSLKSDLERDKTKVENSSTTAPQSGIEATTVNKLEGSVQETSAGIVQDAEATLKAQKVELEQILPEAIGKAEENLTQKTDTVLMVKKDEVERIVPEEFSKVESLTQKADATLKVKKDEVERIVPEETSKLEETLTQKTSAASIANKDEVERSVLEAKSKIDETLTHAQSTVASSTAAVQAEVEKTSGTGPMLKQIPSEANNSVDVRAEAALEQVNLTVHDITTNVPAMASAEVKPETDPVSTATESATAAVGETAKRPSLITRMFSFKSSVTSPPTSITAQSDNNSAIMEPSTLTPAMNSIAAAETSASEMVTEVSKAVNSESTLNLAPAPLANVLTTPATITTSNNPHVEATSEPKANIDDTQSIQAPTSEAVSEQISHQAEATSKENAHEHKGSEITVHLHHDTPPSASVYRVIILYFILVLIGFWQFGHFNRLSHPNGLPTTPIMNPLPTSVTENEKSPYLSAKLSNAAKLTAPPAVDNSTKISSEKSEVTDKVKKLPGKVKDAVGDFFNGILKRKNKKG